MPSTNRPEFAEKRAAWFPVPTLVGMFGLLALLSLALAKQRVNYAGDNLVYLVFLHFAKSVIKVPH